MCIKSIEMDVNIFFVKLADLFVEKALLNIMFELYNEIMPTFGEVSLGAEIKENSIIFTSYSSYGHAISNTALTENCLSFIKINFSNLSNHLWCAIGIINAPSLTSTDSSLYDSPGFYGQQRCTNYSHRFKRYYYYYRHFNMDSTIQRWTRCLLAILWK